jgi:hypothetical protein
MQKARQDLQRQAEDACLREIIDTPPAQLTPTHLYSLLDLVNKDLTNAIVLLGNFVIDRFIGPQELQAVEWQVGSSEHWPWLIHAFAEVGYCTGDMFELCLKRIIAKRSSFSLEHAL